MARCPTCQNVYHADVRRCPADGTFLAVSAAASDATTPATPNDATTPAGSGDAATTPAPVIDTRDRELQPGMLVGEYQLTGRLGAGGMGIVYAGVHPLIGKKVAIKVLNAGLCDDHTMVTRFVQEARAVNQIGHRNIVDIFAFGQLPSGRHYCVMELLPGHSLKARLDTGPLPYPDAFAVLIDVCDALQAAHGEGIVHRDLKPDNIFLAESKSGDRTVKLLDFGIAKLLHQESVASTRSGVPMGTPLYMSPEQCLGRNVDARTDVYSLGVIMFEIFTGQLPFPGPSYIETVNGHLQTAPPRPRSLADVPAPLEAVILRCLAKDPAQRPQTVSELKATLTQLAAELGPGVPERRASTAAAPPVRRTRPMVVSAAVAVALGAAVVVTVLALRPEKPAPPAASTAPATIALQVISDQPGADVFLDGKRQASKTPSVFQVPRAPSFVVRLEKNDYQPYTETVTPAAGETAHAIEAKLVPLKGPAGKLEARALNAKRVTWTVDGKRAGEGDRLAIDGLTAGRHLVRAEAKGFVPREETLEIEPHQLRSVDWMLQPATHASKPPASPKPPPEEPAAEWPPR